MESVQAAQNAKILVYFVAAQTDGAFLVRVHFFILQLPDHFGDLGYGLLGKARHYLSTCTLSIRDIGLRGERILAGLKL